MEVAGQWRREWAGTAEYGKVTEGGVTRRVARAMEVMHSSGPGARVRVLRAAYHSTASAGAPAESFLIHTSRRVISSGSNFLESPTITSKRFEIPSKPFEISSTPLESTPERFLESENYKVTEPDDTEISEPSKWRSSTVTSLRMPSEESSSTADNVSIIDLDTKMNISKHTGLLRKMSFDSDSSEQPKSSYWKSSCRASPLLDTPVTLSTLKYKSLLNGNTDSWNDRRKSYSFEDTSPLNESVLHRNDTLAMESSTDSGICKSTEIVNENTEERVHHIPINKTDELYEPKDRTFKEWLATNRYSKEAPSKSHIDNYIIEEPSEDNISLQSTGKVSISLPVNNKIDDRYQYIKNHINGEIDKRIKKVEFCKTELHFAVESGKVNIIATDEKPPPTNDFRRRRSAFVPIKSTFDKPVITLFGEKIEDCPFISDPDGSENGDVGDSDENTAATKSILKNKIPKPKPYLLGENMLLGDEKSENKMNTPREYIIPTAVSLINKQLQPDEKRNSIPNQRNTKSRIETEMHKTATGLINEGPLYDNTIDNQYFQRFKSGRNSFREDFKRFHDEVIQTDNTNSIKQKLRAFQTSPVMQTKPKTRKLRENEFTYFGVDSPKRNQLQSQKEMSTWQMNSKRNSIQRYKENDLQSVKLIQRISNSVGNSEAESDDTPEYQNIPLKTDFTPVPKPRMRTKPIDEYPIKPLDVNSERIVILKPIVEQSYQVRDTKLDQESRRTRHRRQDNSTATLKTRSISEPPKYRVDIQISPRKPSPENNKQEDSKCGVTTSSRPRRSERNFVEKKYPQKYLSGQEKPEEEALYVNLHLNKEDLGDKKENSTENTPETRSRSRQRKTSVDRRSKDVNAFETENKKKDRDSLNSKSSTRKSSAEKRKDTNRNFESEITKLHKAPKSLNKESKRSETRDSPIEIKVKSTNKSPTRESRRHSSRSEHKQTSKDSQDIQKDNRHESQGKKSHRINDRSLDREAKIEKHNLTHRQDRSRSKDLLESIHENTKSSDRHHHSQTRRSDRKGVDSDTSSKERHKRSEYVINYDDKNGTVSSICKVKPGSSKKKIIHPEKTKESKSKTKRSDKTHHK